MTRAPARPSAAYPHLADFLGGWFHQDFDIEGDTIEAVVAAYHRGSRAGERALVAHDIKSFLSDHAGPADEAFRVVFQPDIEPAGFGLSARLWLERIQALLT